MNITANKSPVLLAAIVTALPFAHAAKEPDTLLGFDLSNALIPRAEILRGGPPKDGIPAIDAPDFVKPADAGHLEDDDLVIGFTAGVESRAYPLRILSMHEIVNDTVGGMPVAVTYCPLCGTSMVFDRRVDGEILSFGVSGLLYQSDVLMYDRQSESLWSQLAMKSVSGHRAGTPLKWIPSEHMTWRSWREKHPDSLVLSTRTGHNRDYNRAPYEEYERSPKTMFPVRRTRDDLPQKEWIAGIIVDGTPKAYRLRSLEAGRWMDDTVGSAGVRVRYDPKAKRFDAELAATGEAIPSVQAYWFAWQAFYTETELWRGNKK